mmetsp:Transcript_20613/g.41809  ORF Transcript_20613/g.41809 Transcript_20613/m.41809 type:complete len:718 (-) Transcript_20613:61-2214(-)
MDAVSRRKRKKLRQKERRKLALADTAVPKDTDGQDDEHEEEDAGEHITTLSVPDRVAALNAIGFDESELEFTAQDLDTAVKVISSLGRNIAAFRSLPFKNLRGALHPLIEEQMKNYDVRKSTKRKRKEVAEYQTLKELDKEWVNRSMLRAKRLAALEELNKASATTSNGEGPVKMLTHMGEVDEAVSELRLHKVADGTVELDATEETSAKQEARRLNIPIQCYTCKRSFVDLHFFYDQLCPVCAELNYRKRNETVDMTGRIALVTGARVKIGFRCALKLLRCGCTVLATSRFASDCARRYAQETDFSTWQHRLHCYGIDFRDLVSVERFCKFVTARFQRLDIIINNACQTIRRPAQYYEHLLEKERIPMEKKEEAVKKLLAGNAAFVAEDGEGTGGRARALVEGVEGVESMRVEEVMEEVEQDCARRGAGVVEAHERAGEEAERDRGEAAEETVQIRGGDAPGRREDKAKRKRDAGENEDHTPQRDKTTGDEQRETDAVIVESVKGTGGAAEMSQMVVLAEDMERDTHKFPQMKGGGAVVDVNEQQLDLRERNSWMLKLNEVSTGELAEVMAINAIAPTILNARLKPLLEASPEELTFVVNVSAMEGKFYRFKTEQHPHTNMAKAALNMMTRTSAQDYVKSGIYMTAVDTGWINDEKPMELAARHGQKHNFQTPLDEVDAAARVLDPIIAPLVDIAQGEKPEPLFGVFLKDFFKCEW